MAKYVDYNGLDHFYDNIADRPVQAFDTMADMQAAVYLEAGMTCHTNGFHASGDGGAAYYTVSASGTADGGAVIALASSLYAICESEQVPYATYIKKGEKAVLYNLAANSDIATVMNATLALNDISIVEVPSGTFAIGATVDVPENKTCLLQGDYHDFGITPTQLTPASNGITMFELHHRSCLVGGYLTLRAFENVTAAKLDVHNGGIEHASISKTRMLGGRESDGVLSQTGVRIECDDLTASTTEHGYMQHCRFDAYIECVGYAYHFHRQRAAATSVTLTENNIYGYIRHCTRYVFYDFASGAYANNSSTIDATIQGGSLISGEENCPGINLMGSDIIVSGKCWDFDSPRQNPAVYFEQSAAGCLVLHIASVKDYNLTNGIITTNLSKTTVNNLSAFKKVPVSLHADAVTNGYITNLANYSYRVGYVTYIYVVFKIGANVPSGSNLFTIDDEGYLTAIDADIIQSSNSNKVGAVQIPTAIPHNTIAITALTASNAWMALKAEVLSNTIASFRF